MPAVVDGPRSPLFHPLPIEGNLSFTELAQLPISEEMRQALEQAPSGECVCPQCGMAVPHQKGLPCSSVQCPSCGSKMIRKD